MKVTVKTKEPEVVICPLCRRLTGWNKKMLVFKLITKECAEGECEPINLSMEL